MAHHAWYRWLRVFGLILFVWIASRIDWVMVWGLVKGIRPDFLAAYFLVFVASLLLKVLRLKVVLKHIACNAGFHAVYSSVVEPAFFGMVTPARVGEFSKVLYLSQMGLSSRTAWGVVLMERAVDFVVLLIASIAGMMIFFTTVPALIPFTISVCLLLMLFAVLRRLATILSLLERFWQKLRFDVELISQLFTLKEGGQKLGIIAANLMLPVSLLILGLSFVQLYLLALALGADISGLYLGLAYSASTLVSLLPVSIGGLGTREAIYMLALGKIGVSESVAVTISLLDGLVFGMIMLFVMALPAFAMRKLHKTS